MKTFAEVFGEIKFLNQLFDNAIITGKNDVRDFGGYDAEGVRLDGCKLLFTVNDGVEAGDVSNAFDVAVTEIRSPMSELMYEWEYITRRREVMLESALGDEREAQIFELSENYGKYALLRRKAVVRVRNDFTERFLMDVELAYKSLTPANRVPPDFGGLMIRTMNGGVRDAKTFAAALAKTGVPVGMALKEFREVDNPTKDYFLERSFPKYVSMQKGEIEDLKRACDIKIPNLDSVKRPNKEENIKHYKEILSTKEAKKVIVDYVTARLSGTSTTNENALFNRTVTFIQNELAKDRDIGDRAFSAEMHRTVSFMAVNRLQRVYGFDEDRLANVCGQEVYEDYLNTLAGAAA